jgi:hypothetical protein
LIDDQFLMNAVRHYRPRGHAYFTAGHAQSIDRRCKVAVGALKDSTIHDMASDIVAEQPPAVGSGILSMMAMWFARQALLACIRWAIQYYKRYQD